MLKRKKYNNTMNDKLFLRTMGLLILLVVLFAFFSCSKKAQENLSNDQKEKQDTSLEASPIDAKDFAESDEDLTTVDYKVFYDQLAPHGEWVQVPLEEVGLKSITTNSEGADNTSFTISNLLGIKDAYGSSASIGMVYVWQPSAGLAVTTTVGETPVYVPYSNGQWVNTDAGWYFKAPTPYEETTSHYGRWVNSPTAGWMWVPGRVWAPAWVDWRQNDTYVSWAPLPPSVYLTDGSINVPVIDNNNYTIVNRNYFLEPNVYKYSDVYYDDGSRILVSGFTVIPGITIVNSTLVNRGPDVSIFQTVYGRNIELVNVNHVRNFNEVRYSDNAYYVYTPVFQRFNHRDKERWSVSEPKSYKRFDDWKEIKSQEKEYRKENKGNDNGNRGNDNGNKGYDNGNKYKYNDNGNKNKGHDNGNKNKGNDNGNKNKGYDNGNKNKGNDHGNKNKGNDNGNRGNDHGNKNKGNDNGNRGNDNGNKNKGNDNGNRGNDNGNKNKGNDNGNQHNGNGKNK